MSKSSCVKILEAMDNGQTLSNVQLSKVAGWRFGGYLFELRKKGVVFKKTKGDGYHEYWKIEKIPGNLLYKGRNSIKLLKPKTQEKGILKKILDKLF